MDDYRVEIVIKVDSEYTDTVSDYLMDTVMDNEAFTDPILSAELTTGKITVSVLMRAIVAKSAVNRFWQYLSGLLNDSDSDVQLINPARILSYSVRESD